MNPTEDRKTKNKNGELEEVQRDVSRELPAWLQEFRENLVDGSTSTEPWGETQSTEAKTRPSHLMNFLVEPRAKVEPGSGWHSVFTHYPKDPNCDICLKTKMTRVVPGAENFGDLIAADHKNSW